MLNHLNCYTRATRLLSVQDSQLNCILDNNFRLYEMNPYQKKNKEENRVNQGGIVSPICFCLYKDELLNNINYAYLSCHFVHR